MILQIIISNGISDLVTGILAKISLGTGIWAKFRLGTGIWYPPSRPSYTRSNKDFKAVLATDGLCQTALRNCFGTQLLLIWLLKSWAANGHGE